MVVQAELATTRLGVPRSTVERGTVAPEGCAYVRLWSWACGCNGEIIGGSLIELHCCELHAEREPRRR
jgi:hypothetical protein